MRKPRDYDAELKALSDKAASLKRRKVEQLGALVMATGADQLPVETLAGALLAAAQTKDTATKEAWRKNGAGFFQSKQATRGGIGAAPDQGASSQSSDQSPPREAGAA